MLYPVNLPSLATPLGIGSVPDPFDMGAYTASDKCPAPNSGLAMLD